MDADQVLIAWVDGYATTVTLLDSSTDGYKDVALCAVHTIAPSEREATQLGARTHQRVMELLPWRVDGLKVYGEPETVPWSDDEWASVAVYHVTVRNPCMPIA